MVEHGLLTVSGAGRLAWEADGRGREIVFVHGFSFDMRMWQPQFVALAATHRVVRYDLRGFGRSSLPHSTYSHVEDLQALIAALGICRPLLVGLSLGANVLLEHALRYPGVARGQVLISAGLPGHWWSSERPPDVIAEVARREGIDAARAAWLAHPIYASLVERHPAADALLGTMVREYHGWHWAAQDPRPAPSDIAARLGEVSLPTLMLSGNTDDPGYRLIADRLRDGIANARLARFAEAGHLLTLEEPERVNQLIGRFDQDLVD